MPEAGHQAGRRLTASLEPVEVVDLDGEPIGVTTRRAMRDANLRHRATYIVVCAPGGEVLVHQRAPWKDIWPSRWDIAFGGVCGVGEPWRDAAARELAEEAGVHVHAHALVALGPIRYESHETRVVGQVYRVEHAGPFTFPDGEVVDHRWVPVAALPAFAASHALCADSEAAVLALLVQR